MAKINYKKCGCAYLKNPDGTVVYVGYCDKHLKEDLEESGCA